MKSYLNFSFLRHPITLLGIGFLVGTFFFCIFFGEDFGGKNRDCLKKYSFTNTNLDCQEYTDKYESLKSLDNAIQKLVDRAIETGKAERVSVWVRDLKTNQNFGINEQEIYSPGSLLKPPLLLSYFKVAEVEPSILEDKIVYKRKGEDLNNIEYFKPVESIVDGKTYTVLELLERAIMYSDNNATLLLYNHLGTGFYERTLVDLGIRIPNDYDTLNFLTVRTYANIFRALFNASYLNRDFSEKALEILSKTTFNGGITHALPEGVTVAHKFGERTVSGDKSIGEKNQLHDCGIVYKKDRPYSICIMTDGKNFDSLISIIREVSKVVYENI